MKRQAYIPLFAGMLMLGGCNMAPEQPAAPQESVQQSDEIIVSKVNGAIYHKAALVPGKIKVKFNPALAGTIEACDASLAELSADTKSGLAQPFGKFLPTKMERLFPNAGEFEPRTKAAGLDRWYVLEYDASADLADIEKAFADVEAVEIVEFEPKLRLYDNGEVIEIFDDPRLSEQWHYYNDGSQSGSASGCDINVYPVWEGYVPGASDVIVAVVDGGIDVEHPDLADNLWTGEGGIHGRNFVTGNSTITAQSHGTHVAGTIGAVNNNGIGVAGVAGGDAARGIPGVRLMSCQIFTDDSSASGDTAIKWAADHGAIICNNSWGYVVDLDENGVISDTELAYARSLNISQSLKDAIDYFIKYAGCDNDGNQLPDSPMKGGLVLFSAGNNNIPYGPPANCYDPIFTVAAVGANYQKASYSCYGDWVDICAPGGDRNLEILSTLPGGAYGTLLGTSMACPHVSGVAALVVANQGGQGFTCADLEHLLVTTARPDEVYNVTSERIGVGLVSAADAVTSGREIEHTIRAEGSSNMTMRLSQTRELRFRVNNPTGHTISASLKEDLPGVSVSVEEGSLNRVVLVRVTGREVAGGEWNVSHNISGTVTVACSIEPGVTHSADFEVTVEANNAPVMLREIEGIVIDRLDESTRISLGNYFFDADGDALSYEVSETHLGEFSISGGQVSFRPSAFGSDEVEITARDEFGGEISQPFPILVRDGSARHFDVYPNPVSDTLFVRTSESCNVTVQFYSESGALVLSQEVRTSPFNPAGIDVSGLKGGLYSVRTSSGDMSQTNMISKL